MKFGCFSVIFAVLFVLPNVAGALTCGGRTCAAAGTWVPVGNGLYVQSAGECDSTGTYCAASAARCATGYFSSTATGTMCEMATSEAGYAPQCDTTAGSCFGLFCASCSTYTGNSNATSDAGTAENACGCYLSNSPSSTQYAGTNGEFKYTSKCYYTDATDCATERYAYISAAKVNGLCSGSVGGGSVGDGGGTAN